MRRIISRNIVFKMLVSLCMVMAAGLSYGQVSLKYTTFTNGSTTDGRWDTSKDDDNILVYSWDLGHSNLMTLYTLDDGGLDGYAALKFMTTGFTESYRVCFMKGSNVEKKVEFGSGGDFVIDFKKDLAGVNLSEITSIAFGGNSYPASKAWKTINLVKNTVALVKVNIITKGVESVGVPSYTFSSQHSRLTFDAGITNEEYLATWAWKKNDSDSEETEWKSTFETTIEPYSSVAVNYVKGCHIKLVDKTPGAFSSLQIMQGQWERGTDLRVCPHTKLSLVANMNSGYTFDGWYDNEACTGTPKYTDLAIPEASYTEDITLYAKATAGQAKIDQTINVTFNGVTNSRRYYVYIPAAAMGKKNVPVVMALHGRYGKITAENGTLKGEPYFNDVADGATDNPFIVVYPQGRNASTDKGTGNWTNGYGGSTGWEATGKENDDTQFINEIVKHLDTDCKAYGVTIDKTRMYLTGFSMGGMMTYAFANACPDVFAAYSVTGGYPINEFHLNLDNISRSPFLHIHAKDDSFVKYSFLGTIKNNMIARYGLKHNATATRDGDRPYDVYDYKADGGNVMLKYVEIYESEKVGHSVAWYAPNIMWDFLNGKTLSRKDDPMVWQWDMATVNAAIQENSDIKEINGWLRDKDHTTLTFGDGGQWAEYLKSKDEEQTTNQNVYPAVQLKDGTYVVYAKAKVGKDGANEGYVSVTVTDNATGKEVLARKLVNNDGKPLAEKTMAYEFTVAKDGEYTVRLARSADKGNECSALTIYRHVKESTAMDAFLKSDESVDNSTVNIEGPIVKITFDEENLKPELLPSDDNGIKRPQPATGYTYLYRNRLNNKNGNKAVEVIKTDDRAFGGYFQNIPHADIYERTGAEDFMRIMLPTDDAYNVGKKVAESGEITIGFWVSGKVAVERGLAYCQPSMFYMAGEKYTNPNSSDGNDHMFNITCGGGISFDMPYEGGRVNWTAGRDDASETRAFGKFCYAPKDNEDLGKFYERNFYIDRNWHYITFQMYDELEKYNMYVDGIPATLGGWAPDHLKQCVKGVKSIVLGGLNADNVTFAQDVAFAYDDIVIYDRKLSHNDILAIIAEKNYTPSSEYGPALKVGVLYDKAKLDASALWTKSDNVYKFKNKLEVPTAITYDGKELVHGLKGLKFSTTGEEQIKLDMERGKLILGAGTKLSFCGIPKDEYIRIGYNKIVGDVTTENIQLATGWVHNGKNVNAYKVGGTDYDRNDRNHNTASITIPDEVEIDVIQISHLEGFAILKYVDAKDEVTSEYLYTDKTEKTNPDGLPKLQLIVNGTSRELSGFKFTYSSSAPHVAKVDAETGNVTVTGVQGSATITAELLHNDKYDTEHGAEILYEHNNRIFATFEVLTKHDDAAKYLVSGTPTLNEGLTAGNDAKLMVTPAGWRYSGGTYQGGRTDEYGSAAQWKGYKRDTEQGEKYTEDKSFKELFGEGGAVAASGTYEAKSEAWDKDDAESGLFAKYDGEGSLNAAPWTLPCRGSHIKIEPVAAGIASVYVLQEGCVTHGADDAEAADPDGVFVRRVYIADETGSILTDVVSETKTKTADQIWKRDGRARSEFYYGGGSEAWKNYGYNEKLFNAFNQNITDAQKWNFLDNWENPGMEQHVFSINRLVDSDAETGDHAIITKGIVRYTFNVLPGKTYYIFSNDSKLGLAGFTFDEGRHINFKRVKGRKYVTIMADPSDPLKTVDAPKAITLEDNGMKLSEATGTTATVTLKRTFKKKQWNAICLPYSINNRQMKAQFGDKTTVILLHKIAGGKVTFVNHTNEDLIAGYPYLIYPVGSDKAEGTINGITTVATFEAENPLFAVAADGSTKAEGTAFATERHNFMGTFETLSLPAGSYYVSNSDGHLKRVGEPVSVKPYRSYLYYGEMNSTPSKAAPMLSSMVVEGGEGQQGGATAIDQVLYDQGILGEPEDVYSANGMKVGHMKNLQSLPKGVYIVNGRKFIKK